MQTPSSDLSGRSDEGAQPPEVQPNILEDRVATAIRMASRLIAQTVGAELGRLGLRIAQLPVLLILSANEGLTQTEIARRVGVEQPTMALTLRRMERDGLITRTRDPLDGRRSHIHLTPIAAAAEPRLTTLRSEIEEQALLGFTDEEREALLGYVLRVTANLQLTIAEGAAPGAAAHVPRVGSDNAE